MSAHRSRVYIAGPMRGIPEFNYPAFYAAADKLRAAGYTVYNPADIDTIWHGRDISKGNETGSIAQASHEHGFDRKDALWRDLEQIFWCDGRRGVDTVALLPGWETSTGAQLERAAAEALGLNILYL